MSEKNRVSEEINLDRFSKILLLINKGLLVGDGTCLVGGIICNNELACGIGGGAFFLGSVMKFVDMMDQGAIDGEM